MHPARRRSSTTIIAGLLLATIGTSFPLTSSTATKDCTIAGHVIPKCDLGEYLKKANTTAGTTVSGKTGDGKTPTVNSTAIIDSSKHHNETKPEWEHRHNTTEPEHENKHNSTKLEREYKHNETKPEWEYKHNETKPEWEQKHNSTEESGRKDGDGGLFKTPDYNSTREGNHSQTYSNTEKPTFSTHTGAPVQPTPSGHSQPTPPSHSQPTSSSHSSNLSQPTTFGYTTVHSQSTSSSRTASATSTITSSSTATSSGDGRKAGASAGASSSASAGQSNKHNRRIRSLLSNLLSSWNSMANDLTTNSLPQLEAAVKAYASTGSTSDLTNVQSLLDSIKGSMVNLSFAGEGAGLSTSQKTSINSTMNNLMLQLDGINADSTQLQQIADLKVEITTIQGLLAKAQISAQA